MYFVGELRGSNAECKMLRRSGFEKYLFSGFSGSAAVLFCREYFSAESYV